MWLCVQIDFKLRMCDLEEKRNEPLFYISDWTFITHGEVESSSAALECPVLRNVWDVLCSDRTQVLSVFTDPALWPPSHPVNSFHLHGANRPLQSGGTQQPAVNVTKAGCRLYTGSQRLLVKWIVVISHFWSTLFMLMAVWDEYMALHPLIMFKDLSISGGSRTVLIGVPGWCQLFFLCVCGGGGHLQPGKKRQIIQIRDEWDLKQCLLFKHF